MDQHIYSFSAKESPLLAEVGGKALSLITMTKAGLPVPGGMVLTTAFFKPWDDRIKATADWKVLLENPAKEKCDALKALAADLQLEEGQKSLLEPALADFEGSDLFAVRSSSPEEDLAGSSFAGMYDTFLGTTLDRLEETIAGAYASMFDYRVVEYKNRKGVNLAGTCISVIIQKQIASDVSGVGFSLNPLNNSYDEAMINASFGLGEAIVSGTVTPDVYIVDKVKMEIIEKTVAEKRIALFLKSGGGVEDVENSKPSDQALSEEQILELTGLIRKAEELYGFPVDAEWAYEGGRLYLLQARPVTTYFPLFDELRTKPGEPKALYVDLMGLTQGFQESMSVLGMDAFSIMLETIKPMMTRDLNGTTPALHGREYLNISNLYKSAGKGMVSAFLKNYDGNTRRIYESLDMKEYSQGPVPAASKKAKSDLMKMSFRAIPGMIKAMTTGYEGVIDDYLGTVRKVMNEAESMSSAGDIGAEIEKALANTGTIMDSVGILIMGILANRKIRGLFKGEDVDADITALSMDLAGNATSEMGYLMFKLASSDEFKNTETKARFIEKIEEGSFSADFMSDYKDFINRFGCRGFKEIDVATPRLWGDSDKIYDRLKEINTEDSQITKVREKREAAYNRLLELARKKKADKKFAKAAKQFQATFGFREHPKYVVVYVFAQLHRILIEVGEEFQTAGRLDEKNHIFDLHIEEVVKARADESVDIRKLREINLKPFKQTEHIRDWPLVFDSRGRIFKPKLELKDGDLAGEPIAPGKVQGRAKVLHTPYEKPLKPGEILVTKATEPSWTPIFINAAGVVMEIGGPLQHGGIIAREYGIPCVSGLIGVMDIIKDGDLLEVDGTSGIVTIIEG